MLALLIVALAARTLIVMPSVQTWLINRATTYLSDQLNTRVEIRHVDIAFFRKIVLEDIYIEDLQKDTLLFAPSLKVNISQFSFDKQKLTINNLELENARIKLTHYKNIKGLNLDFLVHYFSSSNKDTTPSAPWDVKLKAVVLTNATFSYRDLRYNDTTPCIDFDDVLANNLNADLHDLRVDDDGAILFHASNISLKEKSGFVLNHLSADAKIRGHEMDYKNFVIQTAQSKLKGKINFSFKDWDEFSDYIHKVKMTSSFDQSTLASEDVKYFASELIGLHKTIQFSGDIKGTVDRLKGKNMQITYNPKTLFKGDVSLTGLPETEETYIELNVSELRLNKKDIETIPTFPFDNGEKIVLPANLDYLGTVKFNGKFSGFYNDFVAYGNATTDLGFVSSDINLKIGDGKSPAQYSGHVSTISFDIGKMLRLQPDIGLITAKVQVKGSGLAMDRINTILEGSINEFQVEGYTYHNIAVKGDVAKKLFIGSVTARDANADFDFSGQIDYRGKLPIFDFTADLRKANLTKLHLVDRDTSSSLSTRAELHCTGNNLDNVEGSLHFENTNYKEYPRGITLNNLSIHSSSIYQQRQIKLESDFADASMKGDFKLGEIFQSAAYILSQYIPSIKVKGGFPLGNQTFDYRVDLKETRGVLDVLLPDLTVTAGTHIEGRFNTASSDFTARLKSDEVIYKGIRFNGISIYGNTSQGNLIVSAKEDIIQLNDSLLLRNVLLNGKAHHDSAYFDLIIANTDSSLSKIDLGFDMHFPSNGSMLVKVIPTQLLIDYKNWTLDPNNNLLMDSSGITLTNFNFNSGDQSLAVGGKISKNINDKLSVAFKQFNITVINSILKIYDVQLGGIVNGNAAISSIYHKASLDADLSVSNVSFFNDTLGDAKIISDWNTGQGIININGVVTRGGEQNINVEGKYIIKEKNDEIDFTINLKKTNVKTFSNYLTGIASNLSGIASGDFRLHGLASKPMLTGEAHLQKVNFRIDYLNTNYSLSTDVHLKEDRIEFNHVVVNDAKGNKAIANGRVYHNHLRDFYFDIDILANKTQVLNTTSRDNDLFFGVAYATGNVHISGYLDFIKMDIGLKSEKGTKISIPLSNPDEVSHSSFITFIKKENATDTIQAEKIDNSGIEVNFDLEATPDAIIRLEFDPKIGDVIEGTGRGNISLNVSPADGFKMYGDYIIESGQYLFTLQNVLSKEFTIEKGGYVRWRGDPYDADINISANYKNVKASLYDLIPDSTAGYKKLVPVILNLNLSDKLFNPTIKFDVDVKNVDATTEARVRSVINTDEAKYKQAVSLLVIHRFSPAEELSNRAQAISTTDVLGNNAYEFLAAQLSNWASQINENVNVGVNYQPGSNLTQEELEVALSTSFFNDRVTVDGNVGVANNTATTTTNQNTTNLVGDINVEVKANKDGRVRLKAFNRSNNNSLINNLNSPYTQGIGIFYREEFNTGTELWQRFIEKFKKKKPALEETGSLNE